jgi:DNA-binding GntR family transcriptional regulator
MAIDRGAPEWPYEQLAARLRDRIRSGEITRQLPSVAFLSQDSGLSPKTVVKAIRLLESEGLVKTYPNRGTFVVER